MTKNKTTETENSVTDFIHAFVDQKQKKTDSFKLIDFLSECVGHPPKMWGASIIGFGKYHYKYKSGREGEAPILGFSPRKSAISLYVYVDTEKSKALLKDLGKFKMGKACIYVKKLTDIDLQILKQLCQESITYIQAHYQSACHDK